MDADNLSGICQNCKFDIELKGPPFPRIEVKSYRKTTILNMASSPGFKKQLKSYFSEANGIDFIEYHFNSVKLDLDNISILDVKKEFQKIFQQGDYSFFNEISVTGSNIWDDIGIEDIDAFKIAVDTLDPILFSFIQ